MRQKTAVLALFLSFIILFSVMSAITTSAATVTLGSTQVGTYSEKLISGYKDACRYQAPQSGTVGSISMFILTANAQLRFGIYTDLNGRPSQLLGQTNQVTSQANQWITASLNAKVIAGQNYWLTVTTSSPIYYRYDRATGALSGYGTEQTTSMSANFGTFTSYLTAKYSIYATYISTQSTTITPTPTPIPTSIPTPIPTSIPTPIPTQSVSPLTSSTSKYSGANYAAIPNGWDLTYGTGPQIMALDYGTTHSGTPSIRLARHTSADQNYAREVNTPWITVSPGDHVVFRAWVKTGALANSNYDTGAFIGIDFYGKTGILDTQPHGWYQVNGIWHSHGDKNWVNNRWVDYPNTFSDVPASKFSMRWGNSQWTLLEWNLIIPSRTYTTTLPYGTPMGHSEQICGMIAWLGARTVSDNAYAWFADTQLYINPTS